MSTLDKPGARAGGSFRALHSAACCCQRLSMISSSKNPCSSSKKLLASKAPFATQVASSRVWSSSSSLSLPKTGGECGLGGADSPAASGGCSSYKSSRTCPTAGSANSMSIHRRCVCVCFLPCDSRTPPTCRILNTTRPFWSALARSQCAYTTLHVSNVAASSAQAHAPGCAAEGPSQCETSIEPAAASARRGSVVRGASVNVRATNQEEQDAGAQGCKLEEARSFATNALCL